MERRIVTTFEMRGRRPMVAALLGAMLCAASCTTPPPPSPPPPPAPPPVAAPASEPPAVTALSPEPPPPPPAPEPDPPKPEPKKKRPPDSPKRPAMTMEMQEKLARLHLSLLEREAQLRALEKKLDDAMQETVRSKAKLASQESRAEAATNLAEAEVALKTLRGSSKGIEKRPDYARAVQVMAMSTEELKKENYGGSLYLTNQLKSLLRELQDRLEADQAGKAGPGPSALPSGADPETRLARLQAMLSDMDVRVHAAEKKLDDTIQETVRTKAKLRSQENRAEAAANLAEAEGALKTLKGAGVEKQPEFAHATALAAMSADALKKENYSGSLYVANQVKAMTKELSERSQAREAVPVLEGETLFARPLTLKTAAAGKIRGQPSNDSAVAWSIDRGALVAGHAYKGLWIRVRGEDQRWGWLFYDLLAPP